MLVSKYSLYLHFGFFCCENCREIWNEFCLAWSCWIFFLNIFFVSVNGNYEFSHLINISSRGILYWKIRTINVVCIFLFCGKLLEMANLKCVKFFRDEYSKNFEIDSLWYFPLLNKLYYLLYRNRSYCLADWTEGFSESR